jgi:hypothetical protein
MPIPYLNGSMKYGASLGGRRRFDSFDQAVGAKFILFYLPQGHDTLSDSLSSAEKVETTLRMAIKGGIHFLGSAEVPVHIVSIHVDGHEHYGRRMDCDRVVGRLNDLREYCSVAADSIWDQSSDHTKEGCQPYDDCQFLQLTDLLVSGFRTALGEAKNAHQDKIAMPLRALASRWHEGKARMKNSRWHKGFCISQGQLVDEQWDFEEISHKVSQDDCQFDLFQPPL